MIDSQPSTSEDQPVASRTRRSSSTNDPSKSRGNPSRTRSNQRNESVANSEPIDAVTIDELVAILEKDEEARTASDQKLLEEWSFLIPIAQTKIRHKQSKQALKERHREEEEPLDVIERKCDELVELIRKSNHIVVYTGAGISTSASIPDYRGPNGLWTQMRRVGSFSITKTNDLSHAEPTYTHMAIQELCKNSIVDHVVTQNCDGLHLRSGMSQKQLSEIHGNMFIEVCPTCERQYFRQADVTAKTSRFRHKTGRKCHSCAEPNNNLVDTIVLYGERSRTTWPMNWDKASKSAVKSNLIICIGSSLKTLRRYSCLWPRRPYGGVRSGAKGDPRLVIINLQYTSKDRQAALKINGRCDLVMQKLMQKLQIQVPHYVWTEDPLLRLAVPFTRDERKSLNRRLIFRTRLKQQRKLWQEQQQQHQQQQQPADMSDIDPSIVSVLHESGNQTNRFSSAMKPNDCEHPTGLRMLICNIKQSSDLLDAYTSDDTSSAYSEHDDNDDAADNKMHALPGWLGKGLGMGARATQLRRKRVSGRQSQHEQKAMANLDVPNEDSTTVDQGEYCSDAVKTEFAISNNDA